LCKIPSTNSVSEVENSQKSVCGRGSAPDPAGGAHDAPPDPLVGWGGGNPLPRPHHPRRLRRFASRCLRHLELSHPPILPISPPNLGCLHKTLTRYRSVTVGRTDKFPRNCAWRYGIFAALKTYYLRYPTYCL